MLNEAQIAEMRERADRWAGDFIASPLSRDILALLADRERLMRAAEKAQAFIDEEDQFRDEHEPDLTTVAAIRAALAALHTTTRNSILTPAERAEIDRAAKGGHRERPDVGRGVG